MYLRHVIDNLDLSKTSDTGKLVQSSVDVRMAELSEIYLRFDVLD